MSHFKTNNRKKLNSLQKDLLLDAIAYYMDQELRQKIKQELPLAYENWMSQRVEEL